MAVDTGSRRALAGRAAQAHADYARPRAATGRSTSGRALGAYAVLIAVRGDRGRPVPLPALAVASGTATTSSPFPPQWLPKSLYLGNFGAVLHQTSYLRWGLNTFIFATSVTLITLVIDTLAGYAFARLRFPGRRVLFGLVIATLMIPTAAIVAPLYIIISNLPGWTHAGVNTYPGMVLPMVVQPARRLHDAAVHLDAARRGSSRRRGSTAPSEFQIFRKIVLPLMKPAIVVLGHLHVHVPVGELPLAARDHDDRQHEDADRRDRLAAGTVRDQLGRDLGGRGDDDAPDHHRLPDLPELVRAGVDGGRAQAVTTVPDGREGRRWQRS